LPDCSPLPTVAKANGVPSKRASRLAGDDQLGGGETDRFWPEGRVMLGKARHRCGIALSGHVAQFLGAAAQLAEIGALG